MLHGGNPFCNGFFALIGGASGGSLRGMIAGADAMLSMTCARQLKLKNEELLLSVENAIVNAPLDDHEAVVGRSSTPTG